MQGHFGNCSGIMVGNVIITSVMLTDVFVLSVSLLLSKRNYSLNDIFIYIVVNRYIARL